MSHNEWQDMIPFYVAGTLNQADKLNLEKHLAHCYLCQEELVEWRVIAEATVRKAQILSQGLPLLSSTIKASLIARPILSPNGLHQSININMLPTLKIRRVKQSRIPATLAASVIMALIFVVILILATRPKVNDTASVLSKTRVFVTNTMAYTATSESTVTPTNTPVPTLTIAPTTKPQAAIWPTTTTIPVVITPTPPRDVCSVSAISDAPVAVYQWPESRDEVTYTLTLGEFLRSVVFDGNDWYQVIAPQGGIAGWVNKNEVLLHGPCEQLVTPTPTVPANMCLLRGPIDNSRVNLYTQPDQNSEILAIIEAYDMATIILGRHDEWYQVRYDRYDSIWIGWVYHDALSVYGYCSELQDIAVPTIAPMIESVEVLSFYSNVQEAEPGDTLTLAWEVKGATDVTIGYYDIGLDLTQNDFESDGFYNELASKGTLDVIISPDYAYRGIEFALLIDAGGLEITETITVMIVNHEAESTEETP